MAKKIILTMVGLLILIGLLGGIKGIQINHMIAQGKQFVPPPEPVTTTLVRSTSWESLITAVGSLEAVQGVLVAAEMNGKIVQIGFEPGAMVQKGDLLIQQDIVAETAQLRAAEATVAVTRLNLERFRRLLPDKVISQADYDNADAQFKQAAAQADSLRAIMAKKTVRAPFAGRLGMRLINLGQILDAGDPIVSLQSLDPIFVNFLIPQHYLPQLKTGLPIRIKTDALTGQVVEGQITAIHPQVDPSTRNLRIQATVSNVTELLRPGMYVSVSVVKPAEQKVLAIPATAVLYAAYSDSVFVVEESANPSDLPGKPPGQLVRQQFVQLGEQRGDFIAVTSGLKEGQTVVSTGAFKLRNNQTVVVDNSLAPKFALTPKPDDS